MAGVILSGFLVCVAIIALLLRSKLAWRIATDVPNGRSLHQRPIPRIGGWGLVPAAIITSLAFTAPHWYLAAISAAVFAISYFDDRVSLPIYIRLPAHVAAAAAWLALGPVSLPIGIAAMAAFAIAWVTNFFNFMDGADGLAGGMAVIGFSAYAAVASWHGVAPLAVWSLALAAASAGFLLFNFPPARIFLGDAGSVTVGFLAGAFGIWGWAAGAWPVWFPFLVAAPFFLDATATILRRMFSGKKFWQAHREHYYQRLIRSGWSHRRTAFAEYGLMAASAGFAVLMLQWSPHAQYGGLAIAAMIYAAIGWAVDRRWAAFQNGVQRVPARLEPGAAKLAVARERKDRHAPVAAEAPDAPLIARRERSPARSRRVARHEDASEFIFHEPVMTAEAEQLGQK